MSMHLEKAWLSTTGRKKTKRQYQSAEHAKKARENQASWEKLLKQYTVPIKQQSFSNTKQKSSPVFKHRGENCPVIPSLSLHAMEPCLKSPTKAYTGNNCIGVAVLHKSCLQPIFNKQSAIDAATMRRS